MLLTLDSMCYWSSIRPVLIPVTGVFLIHHLLGPPLEWIFFLKLFYMKFLHGPCDFPTFPKEALEA
jgi:hypothetical protein